MSGKDTPMLNPSTLVPALAKALATPEDATEAAVTAAVEADKAARAAEAAAVLAAEVGAYGADVVQARQRLVSAGNALLALAQARAESGANFHTTIYRSKSRALGAAPESKNCPAQVLQRALADLQMCVDAKIPLDRHGTTDPSDWDVRDGATGALRRVDHPDKKRKDGTPCQVQAKVRSAPAWFRGLIQGLASAGMAWQWADARQPQAPKAPTMAKLAAAAAAGKAK
jgi:hypothetical protein